jgi:hypothetical protein
MVVARAEVVKVSVNSIYKWLRRYWQGGLRKNALIPYWEWNRRGGKGVQERPETAEETFKDKKTGKVWKGLQAVMAWGLRTFRAKGFSLQYIRDRLNEKYFRHGEEMKDGVIIPVVKKVRLTQWQLRYFYRTFWDKAEELKEQLGESEYRKTYRALSGTVSKRVRAPGECFQLDAYITDLILVSPLNRTVKIGKAILCFAVDQFSHLICGFSISLHDESYITYMLAIENAASNKQAYCGKYGRTISNDQWPCEHLAKTLALDRGPLRKWQGNHLVNSLGIDLENGPPYQPDLRGLVERVHLTIKAMLKKRKGYTGDTRPRGAKRMMGEATLDMVQLRKHVINEILYQNSKVLTNYRLTAAMIRDEVPAVPIKLWEWGIRTQSGCLRQESPEVLRLNLLPQGEASVRPEGLVFEGRLYECDPQMREQARRTGRFKVLVHADPRVTDVIYLRRDLRIPEVEICTLSPGDDAWTGSNVYEHEAISKRTKEIKAEALEKEQHARSERDAYSASIDKDAQKLHREALRDHGLSKNEPKVSPTQRELDEKLEDQAEGWRLTDQSSTTNQTVRLEPVLPTERPSDGGDAYWDSLDQAKTGSGITMTVRRSR